LQAAAAAAAAAIRYVDVESDACSLGETDSDSSMVPAELEEHPANGAGNSRARLVWAPTVSTDTTDTLKSTVVWCCSESEDSVI